MRRNLEHRVEVLVPVEAPELRKDLWALLDVQLSDRRSAWELQSDGSYVQFTPGPDDNPRSAQERLIEQATRRGQDTGRLRRRKSKGFGGRNLR
jgi:polyphosphate kinase